MKTACESLESDHRQIIQLLEEAVAAVATGDLRTVRLRFPEFACRLRNHMRYEEDHVFPVVELTLCHAEGSVCVLRRDHREIEDRLVAMTSALYLGDLGAFSLEHQELNWLLENHLGREERVLYPAMARTACALP
jgi:iron-sulfur cluster repair protein YtfE (RIC family)